MAEFQANEGLTEREFKDAVEDVGERHPFLVKLMIASWEFPQFIEMCREYVNDHEEELGDEKSDGKVKKWWFVFIILYLKFIYFLDREVANMMMMMRKITNEKEFFRKVWR